MLIDYTMGHGALILGHAHPAVVAAVQAQVARGTHYGAGHPLEVEWAERICSMVDSVDEVRFTASGTEAAMLAVRVARAATGRDVLVKLDGHFHGWSDPVSANLVDGEPRTSTGVPVTQLLTTRVVRAGDLDALRAVLDTEEVAAVIFEGSGAHYGRVPLPDGYAAALRAECDRAGALLIIDEVVTGFRVATGGMQSLLGVRPDLSMFGKVMAGGLPGGAIGGRRDLMELLATTIEHPGTFNANPLTAAAGIATLDICAERRPAGGRRRDRHAAGGGLARGAARPRHRRAGVAAGEHHPHGARRSRRAGGARRTDARRGRRPPAHERVLLGRPHRGGRRRQRRGPGPRRSARTRRPPGG